MLLSSSTLVNFADTRPMTLAHPPLQFSLGLPYGAVLQEGGVHFVVVSRNATAMRVLLYDHVDDPDPADVIACNPELDRWGDVWSVFVPGIGAGQLYHFQADGPFEPQRGHRFNGKARLIDPYARALAGKFLPGNDGVIRPPKCVVVDDTFDWEGDRHLKRNLSESVIYETHVKGFTASKTSGVKWPGTYRGLIEKIPYLKDLGITAVELMPVHDFPTEGWYGEQLKRVNYWGYDPMAFFAPHRGYAADTRPGGQVREFKEMVKELHRNDIEVILDVVFNHTCEGNEHGPTLSFKGLENGVYYMLAGRGEYYKNYSGCGNTINGNHPIVREMIFHCLRYWVHNYHVDGFRFDLASILSRNREGDLVPNPPLVEQIAEDPLLADTKIIAEAWDAAGAYQVGSFANRRWAEWNGRYRDDARRFWRGDPGTIGSLATRLAGSSDLYASSGRRPYHSINFITSHDGFPLNDLVSYSHKHNEENGEDNRDGDNQNYSENFGVEGPTRRKDVNQMRARQIRNMFTTLLLSQGVPMVLAGDECRRTQRGNNNAYCQDGPISWFDWTLVEKNEDMVRFVKTLVDFRRKQPTVRRSSFVSGTPAGDHLIPDVSWFDAGGHPHHWNAFDHSLISIWGAWPSGGSQPKARHVMLLIHSGTLAREFTLPDLAHDIPWRLFINTAAESPHDIYPELDGPAPLAGGRLVVPAKSILAYVSPPVGE
jgi:glycogen operon protein